LTGIANQSFQTDDSIEVATILLKKLQNCSIDEFTFDQKLDIIWSACALGLE
jgi:hypothetical protein